MTPTIFAGIIRNENDANETMGLQRMLQYDKVYVTGLVCEKQGGDVKSSVVHLGCLQQLYQHQNMYEWFVLTADVVNLHVLPTLLLSLPHHVPVSLVYPECPSLSYLPGLPHLLILNQATLHLLLRESTRSANSTICTLMQDTINLPLEKVTAMYERTSHGDTTNVFHMKTSMPKDNFYTALIRQNEARLRQLQIRTVHLTQSISYIDITQLSEQPLSPVITRRVREGRYALKEWDFINASVVHALSNSNAQPTETIYNRGRELILNKSLNIGMNVISSTRPAYTYQRVVVGRAVEHIMVNKHTKSSILPNYKTIQRFDTLRFQEIKTQRDLDLVIVLPLLKRSADFIRFIKRLRSVALDFKGSLMLNVVLFRDQKGEYKRSFNAANQTSDGLVVKVVKARGKFTRSGGIAQGIAELEEETRVLIMDVDVMFTINFLNRVVRNTRQGKSAFFPIYFSRYDLRSIQAREGESTKRFLFGESYGMWRYFSYGVVGIYKSDILDVGNFDRSLQGWGMEDVKFYDQCLSWKLPVFRTVDPGLWHMYHPRHCDPHLRLEQLEMCFKSRLELQRSQRALAMIVFNLTRSNLMR
ncbi:chondroitin sulfate synthase sqv-5-like [Haliotis rufescens]|uniref:chondroitin sulfate synthase sqv-5-like n=1 Tax=Haliotis rufescens TaxID=6454 RepID=UPI00201F4F16|nr:chondroitin sulfate synthase sqv-5-like [Haliotis rufescens]